MADKFLTTQMLLEFICLSTKLQLNLTSIITKKGGRIANSAIKPTSKTTPNWVHLFANVKVTRMIEWGQKSKPNKIPGPNINPQNSHAEVPSLKNFHKALKGITSCTLFG